MSGGRREQNLKRVLHALEAHLMAQGATPGPANEVSPSAAKISGELFLAHSTSDVNFAKLCPLGGRLLSPAALDASGLKALKADAVERELDTAGYVFLYASSFAFPNSGCGLLFAPSLERERPGEASATPFDSGGLVKVFRRVDMGESARDFFARHELPVSGYRDYLARCLDTLFAAPLDYLAGWEPRFPCPLGLSLGDQRRWTHEVRIPDQVHVRGAHLQALFVPRRLSLHPEIEPLLNWTLSEGYDVEIFETGRENDFDALKNRCLEYLRAKLLSP